MIVFLNGNFLPEAEALISINDRGFLLGDGLFETMRVVNGRPFRMAQHLERMTRGLDYLKITLPFHSQGIAKICHRVVGPESNCRIQSCASRSPAAPDGGGIPRKIRDRPRWQ